MRLIDADMICKYCDNNINHSITPNEIMRMPFIDAEPVKHGRWRKRMSTSDSLKCTNCGNSHEYETTYCPHCGARMDGGADEWTQL